MAVAEVIERTWLEDQKLTFQTAERLERQHARRNSLNRQWLKKKYDLPDEIDDTRRHPDVDTSTRRRGYNLIAELTESAAAQVTRPLRAALVPVGGDPKTTQNCKAKNRLLDGVFSATDFLEIAGRVYDDLQVADIGALDWDFIDGRFVCRRLLSPYLLWEMTSSDTPRSLFYIDEVARAELYIRYPQHRSVIKSLPRYAHPNIPGVDMVASGQRSVDAADTVKVVRAEAITIGDSKGRFVLSCANGLVLENKVWPYPKHRIVVGRWRRDYKGFGGLSAARRIEGYHDDVQVSRAKVRRSLRGAVPTIVASEESAMDATFSDIDFNKIVYPQGGVAPQIVVPQVVSGEVLADIDKSYYRAAAETGASQQLANGNAPSGVTSGKGMREYVAIANQRLVAQQLVWNKLWTDSAEVILMLGDSIFSSDAKRIKPIPSKPAGQDFIEAISWLGPEELKAEEYKVEMELSSGMSNNVAGKFDDIDKLQQLGMADNADVARALSDGMPDVAALSDRLNAPRDYADYVCMQAIEHGRLVVPGRFIGQHLNELLTMAQQRWMQYSIKKSTRPEQLNALRKLIEAVQARIASAPSPAPVPGAPMPGGAAPVVPGAAPAAGPPV